MRQWSSFKNLPNIDFLGAVIILQLKEVAGAYGGRQPHAAGPVLVQRRTQRRRALESELRVKLEGRSIGRRCH